MQCVNKGFKCWSSVAWREMRKHPFCWTTNYKAHCSINDSKVHGANMRPIYGRQDTGGPHVGPMNSAIWDVYPFNYAYDYVVHCFAVIISSLMDLWHEFTRRWSSRVNSGYALILSFVSKSPWVENVNRFITPLITVLHADPLFSDESGSAQPF